MLSFWKFSSAFDVIEDKIQVEKVTFRVLRGDDDFNIRFEDGWKDQNSVIGARVDKDVLIEGQVVKVGGNFREMGGGGGGSFFEDEG